MNIKSASVSVSQIAASGRMDARYHIARQGVAQHLDLFADLTHEQATTIAQELAAITPPALLAAALGPLARGSAPREGLGQKQALALCQADPHLALALLHKHLPQIIEHHDDLMSKARKDVDAAAGFAAKYPLPAAAASPRKPRS